MQACTMLRTLEQDATTPKNARTKITGTLKLLEQGDKLGMSKAMHEIEALSSDVNMPAHLRTQLFSVVSLLEIA